MSCVKYYYFFKDTATTEIYTLSLHDALPILQSLAERRGYGVVRQYVGHGVGRRMHEDPQVPNYGNPGTGLRDRKSTRLNSSHANISYAVFCLKKNTIIIDRFSIMIIL